jgi:hypothetical protein
MATYGNPNGQIAFTGWSPTLGSGPANVPDTVGAVQFNGLTQEDYEWAADFNFQANRRFRALLYALVGTAAGAMATSSYVRVLAQQAMNNPFALGGLVPIETTTYVNRNTLAGDVTNIKALLDRRAGNIAYVPDLSGNGGSGGVPNVIW